MSFGDPVELYHVIKRSWSQDSTSDTFDPANPCRNQCAVTALAVQQLMGGDLLKTETQGGTHFYNRVDGRIWDLAADQFVEPIPYDNTPTTVAEAHEHASEAHLAALLASIATQAKKAPAA